MLDVRHLGHQESVRDVVEEAVSGEEKLQWEGRRVGGWERKNDEGGMGRTRQGNVEGAR